MKPFLGLATGYVHNRKRIQMKIAHKLTIAFIFVGLLAIGLAALFIYVNTSKGFDLYVANQRSGQFVSVVTAYFDEHGQWRGVDTELRRQGLIPPLAIIGQKPPDPQPLALLDENRKVLVAGGPYKIGEKVQNGVRAKEIEIKIDGRLVGTVLQTGQTATRSEVEQQYLNNIQNSLWIAGGLGLLVAISLGVTLSRSLSLPIRQLTDSAKAMMKGDLSQRITIKTSGELAELAKAFNQLSSDLYQSRLTQHQMTADIAHDLNNPLTVISGYTEAMQNGTLEPTPQRLSLILDEVTYLQTMVNDLRTLSLADSGELTLQKEEADIAGLLQTVQRAFQQRADQAGVNLNIEADPDLPKILWDGQRIRQVMENLVINALRHTSNGGKITLQAFTKNGALVLGVQDNGSGIATADLARIFERSYRGDQARSSEGSGLGLAIARSIMQLHGGEIHVESELGKGSLFTIKFPTN